MKNKVSPYIVALPALVILSIFVIWPLVLSFVMSFWDYWPKDGIRACKFVGLDNYMEFFTSALAPRVLKNSVILTLLPAAMTAAAAFVGALCIRVLPNRRSKLLAVCIIAIPALIPKQMLFGAAAGLLDMDSALVDTLVRLHILEQKQNLRYVPQYYPWIYSVAETLRYMVYPMVIGAFAIDGLERGYIRIILRIVGIYFLFRLCFLLLMDVEMLTAIYSPMTYQTGDTLGSYVYRKGFLEAEFGYSAAIDNIRTAAQLGVNVLLFSCIRKLTKFSGRPFALSDSKNHRISAVIGLLGCALLSAGSAGVIYFLISGAISANFSTEYIIAQPTVSEAIINSIIYSISGALLFTVISVLLAYPLSLKSKWYKLFTFLLLFTGGTISQYFIFKYLGLLHTGIGYIIYTGVSVWGAWILHLIAAKRTNEIKSFKEFVCSIAPSLSIIFAVGFIVIWNDYNGITILQSRDKFPVTKILNEMLLMNHAALTESPAVPYENAVKYIWAAIMSLPSVIAGWLVIWNYKCLLAVGKRKDDK